MCRQAVQSPVAVKGVKPPASWKPKPSLAAPEAVLPLGDITSTEIREPKDWQDESLLIPHEPIRRMMAEAEVLIPQIKGLQTWKVDRFFAWYNEVFYFFVHHHHDAEESIFFPWLSAKEGCVVAPKLCADHVTLMQLLEDIKNMQEATHEAVASWTGGAAAAIQLLHQKWQEMQTLMLEHLAEEERDTPEQLRKHCTFEEHEQMVGKILASLGLHGNKIMLPRILSAMQAWGGPAKTEEFKKGIPPPIRFLNHYFWEPEYRRSQQLLQSLALDSPQLERLPTEFGCAAAMFGPNRN